MSAVAGSVERDVIEFGRRVDRVIGNADIEAYGCRAGAHHLARIGAHRIVGRGVDCRRSFMLQQHRRVTRSG